jgi:fibronectin type 3 domain-containing protein
MPPHARLRSCLILAALGSSTGWCQGGYVPYDGADRYTLAQDDGLKGIQGLVTLASRHGLKPYELLGQGGQWQTERVIFTDLATGATIYRLTNDPFADELSYFKGNVSADGSTLVFRRRPGMWEASTATHGPMAMSTDGTGLRNAFRDFGLVRRLTTSFTDPRLCFATGDETKLVAFDLHTGKLDHEIARLAGTPWHLKTSFDGQYLMGRGKLSSGENGIWIYRVDGQERYEVPIPESIHDSYQFVPGQRKMMYWLEGKFYDEGFVQRDFDGGNLTPVNVQFDWNHGDCGFGRGAHCEGYITRFGGNTWGPKEWLCKADPNAEYYDDPADANGYLAWRPKDELWAYGTRIVARPYLSEIHLMALEPVPGDVADRCRLCFTNLHRGAALDSPESSPDGTKVFFNSTMLGSCSVYMVVARKPDPPSDVMVRPAADGVALSWQPGKHHAETRAYHVYRSGTSGSGYAEVTTGLFTVTSFTDRTAPRGRTSFYVVTAQEFSGLEGRPSAEVSVAPAGVARTLTYLEAESGGYGPEVWKAFHGSASDLYYVWARRKGVPGKLSLPVNVPHDGAFRAWVRACSLTGQPVGLKLTAGATTAGARVAGQTWSWLPLAGDLRLRRGAQTLQIELEAYGGAVDQVALATGGLAPSDAPRLPGFGAAVTTVNNVRAEACGPFAVRLGWTPVKSPRLQHYHLYQGLTSDFAASRTALVGSPDGPEYVDWSLRPGTTYYYRVSAIDTNGVEVVSPAVGIATQPLRTVQVALPVAEPPVVPTTGEQPPAARASACEFEVAEPGQYVVWLKLRVGRGPGQYLEVGLDDGPKVTWTVQLDGQSDTPWFRYNEFAAFGLVAGKHTLALANHTAHTITDALITNDRSFAPEGHVNMPTGW